MMKVYLSGPMSGMACHLWRARFNVTAEQLRQRGYEVVNPATFCMAMWPWLYRLLGYKLTILYDLYRLSQCDFICPMRDWQTSRGSRIEVQWAQEFAIPSLSIPDA
jgi:hypothetical protein